MALLYFQLRFLLQGSWISLWSGVSIQSSFSSFGEQFNKLTSSRPAPASLAGAVLS